ncbi:MAG: SDR family oxidoreductase [Eubacteriales bacterium]|nr:SDR family oxidoreductase [Eubacteriales bacterium]
MKTALITGGGRGIGAALTRAFAGAEYRVAFFYGSNHAAAKATASQTGALAVCCDVSDPEAVKAAVATLPFSHVDALVNNAGVAQQKLFTDITDEDWRHMLDVHLSGAFYVTRAVLPGMISQKYGRIVNVSSIWGQVGASCEVHYSAAKAGLIGLTRALAKETAPSGVTVNCLCPGVIETDMLNCFSLEERKALQAETPVGRLGTPEDVARAALWLCEAESDFVTGQIIGINGGFGE